MYALSASLMTVGSAIYFFIAVASPSFKERLKAICLGIPVYSTALIIWMETFNR